MDRKAMENAFPTGAIVPNALNWHDNKKVWLKCKAWDITTHKFITTGIMFNNSTMQLESIPDIELLLYTDKKDSQNVLACEGDIIKCICMHDSNVWDAWSNHKAKHFVIKRDTIGFIYPSDFCEHPDWWLIIGNIKENPELMENNNEKDSHSLFS